jgi:hypothetical protein
LQRRAVLLPSKYKLYFFSYTILCSQIIAKAKYFFLRCLELLIRIWDVVDWHIERSFVKHERREGENSTSLARSGGEGKRKREEGRGKREEGRGKREEGRGRREEKKPID